MIIPDAPRWLGTLPPEKLEVRVYWHEGRIHRDDAPAVLWADGSEEWFRRGRRHRDVGPACSWSDETRLWFVEGKLHREGGPALEWSDGMCREWWVDGLRHRVDYPVTFTPRWPADLKGSSPAKG